MEMNNIPDGFKPLRKISAFVQRNGPIYYRRDVEGVTFGYRVKADACNVANICHGGWLSTIADVILPLTAAATIADLNKQFLLTVNLSLDFVGAAPLGAWLESRGKVLRKTRNLVFVEGHISHDDVPVVRCSGLFRIGREIESPSVLKTGEVKGSGKGN